MCQRCPRSKVSALSPVRAGEQSRLCVNGECVAEGVGLPALKPAQIVLVIGSTQDGKTGIAGGHFEELEVLGRGVDEDNLRMYYSALSRVVALGPISDEEFAAQMESVARITAERQAAAAAAAMAGEMDLLFPRW